MARPKHKERGPKPANVNYTQLVHNRLAHRESERETVERLEERITTTVSVTRNSADDAFIHPSRRATNGASELQPEGSSNGLRPDSQQRDTKREPDNWDRRNSLPRPLSREPRSRSREDSRDERSDFRPDRRHNGYNIEDDYRRNSRGRSPPRRRQTSPGWPRDVDSPRVKQEERDITNFLDDVQEEFGRKMGVKPEDKEYNRSERFDLKREVEACAQLAELHGNDWAKTEEEEADTKADPTKVVPPPAPVATGLKSRRSRKTFMHERSSLKFARSQFKEIETNIYQYEGLGETSYQEAMSCDCKPEVKDGKNHACGEDSDCINRMTSMECTNDDCNCGDECANQRFQQREYANIDVFETEKKGFGIRMMEPLHVHQFIYEYVGEVIDEPTFHNRTTEYHDEGIRHFYFMMLQAGEFLDATRLGGLGRFCNHSCNPNCYVDKWVVGSQLRMGIFAKRRIDIGEELTFDYNVDRYGADAQPCYCEEPNCIGYIGGKTQSEAQPKLSHTTLQALGLDETKDWTRSTAQRARRKSRKDDDEDDDDYVDEPSQVFLEEEAVPAVMSTLLKSKEKWVVSKLIQRIQVNEAPGVQRKVMRMHGYQILGAVLLDWKDDRIIAKMVLEILLKWPRLTKNKISSSSIETTVRTLREHENESIKSLSVKLLAEWETLEMAYRIPRGPKALKPESPEKAEPAQDTPKDATQTQPRSVNALHRPDAQPSPNAFRQSNRNSSSNAGAAAALELQRQEEMRRQQRQAGPKVDLMQIIEAANKEVAEREAQRKAEEARQRAEEEKQQEEERKKRKQEKREKDMSKDDHHHKRKKTVDAGDHSGQNEGKLSFAVS